MKRFREVRKTIRYIKLPKTTDTPLEGGGWVRIPYLSNFLPYTVNCRLQVLRLNKFVRGFGWAYKGGDYIQMVL